MWLYLPTVSFGQDAFVNASFFNFRKIRDYLNFFKLQDKYRSDLPPFQAYSFISLSIQQCLLGCYYVLATMIDARNKTMSKRWYLSSAKFKKDIEYVDIGNCLPSRLSFLGLLKQAFLSSAIRQVKILAHELWEEVCWGAHHVLPEETSGSFCIPLMLLFMGHVSGTAASSSVQEWGWSSPWGSTELKQSGKWSQ